MIGCAFPLLLIGGSQSALAALFYIAASFPWVVKMGRRVVIFFFPKEIAFLPWLCSSPAACRSGRCYAVGARIYHCAFFFPEWHILMGHCLEQRSKAWCVSIHEDPLLFTLLWFPSGSIRYQSSLKHSNQPTKEMQKRKNIYIRKSLSLGE